MKTGKQFERFYTDEGRMCWWTSSLNQGYVRVWNYLEHVLKGEEGKPFCPFVRMIHQGNGYYVSYWDEEPVDVDFEQVVKTLLEKFRELSPRPTVGGQAPDITTIIAAFTHPDAMSPEFGQQLTAARDHHRQSFLDQGLMLAQMFPEHDDDKGGGRYQSRIPLLMVRHMHTPDHVFMLTEPEQAAYVRFFCQPRE